MIRARVLTGGAVVIAIVAMLTVAACGPQTAQNPPAVPDTSGKGAPNERAQNTAASVAALFDKLSAVQPPSQGSRAVALLAAAPPADSSKVEQRSQTTDASSAKPYERVGYDSVDPAQLLPSVTAQVPQVWIGWYVNRSIDAFRQAIDENKPMVLVVGEGWCKYCLDFVNDSLRCAAVDRFAGDAVFAYSYVSSDLGASAIAGSLSIEGYPTITVLEPESRILLERGRINGYFESTPLGDHLETILWKTQPRVLPPGWDDDLASGGTATDTPATASTPSLVRPSSFAGAVFGAQSRGLTHIPPEPKCR